MIEGKKMYEEILDQMQELLKDEMKNFGDDFGKLEQAVMEMMMSLGKGLLQRLVDSNANGYKASLLCKKALANPLTSTSSINVS